MLETRSPRSVRVDLRCTPAEKAAISELARTRGQTVADYIRCRALAEEAVADQVVELRQQLTRERAARAAADQRAQRVLVLEGEVQRLRRRLERGQR